jgi:hypothetical protein
MLVRGGGLGDIGDAATVPPAQAAIYARLRAARAALSSKAVASLSGSMTLQAYAAAVAVQAQNARGAVETVKAVSFVTADQRAEIARLAAELAALAGSAKLAAARNPNGRTTPTTALGLVRRLQAWYDGIVGSTVTRHASATAEATKIVGAVRNAPGSALRWGGEQLGLGLQGLGLPSWALPAALVVAGLAVAAPYIAPGLASARRAFR